MTTLVALTISAVVSYRILEDNAREEILEKARIMMERASAVLTYTVNEIKPLLKVQQRRSFIPQTVSAYPAHRYIKALQESHTEYSYKEATLNPTNPTKHAAEWEADIVNWFRNHSDVGELSGERATPRGQQLYMGRPITIKNPECLTCHSTPAGAPETPG